MEVEQKLRDFIIQQLQWDGPPEQLTDDYALLDNRVLDSLGIFKTVTFVEDEFDISVDDDELLPDNFGSIRSIGDLVRRKKSED